MTTTRTWYCNSCGGFVHANYDHVGDCRDDATEEDCAGTFAHPRRSSCLRRGLDLTHDFVKIYRPPVTRRGTA